MNLYDVSFSKPEDNILFDDVLLHLAEKQNQGEFVRFWMSEFPFIVLGKIGKAEEDLHIENIQQDCVSVLRRSSGGGTVVQGPGCLNFTFVLSKERDKQLNDIGKSYQLILQFVTQALGDLGVKTKFMPISDLVLEETNNKISGNAQRRARQFILHHGTILVDFDLSLIERYLKIPKDMPEYRQKRGHLSFVQNVSLDIDEIKKSIKKCFDITTEHVKINKEQDGLLQEFSDKQKVVVDLNNL